jgi:hypothetical protein
MLYIDLDVIDI